MNYDCMKFDGKYLYDSPDNTNWRFLDSSFELQILNSSISSVDTMFFVSFSSWKIFSVDFMGRKNGLCGYSFERLIFL